MVGAVDALEVSNPPTADDLEEIAERVPDLRGYPLRAERLPGGLTNLNYRVRGAPQEYVLRVTGAFELPVVGPHAGIAEKVDHDAWIASVRRLEDYRHRPVLFRQ